MSVCSDTAVTLTCTALRNDGRRRRHEAAGCYFRRGSRHGPRRCPPQRLDDVLPVSAAAVLHPSRAGGSPSRPTAPRFVRRWISSSWVWAAVDMAMDIIIMMAVVVVTTMAITATRPRGNTRISTSKICRAMVEVATPTVVAEMADEQAAWRVWIRPRPPSWTICSWRPARRCRFIGPYRGRNCLRWGRPT